MSTDTESYDEARPVFYIGQHDSARAEPLTDLQYGQVLNSGFSYVTSPITNRHFHERIKALVASSIKDLEASTSSGSRPDPIVPPLTGDDTALYPSTYTSGYVAYSSPWLDLCSTNHVVSSISRQVLNLEIAYANFCGVRSIIIPGPRTDAVKAGNGQGIAQYARAIQEALLVGTRINIIIHLPMYREPGLEEKVDLLSDGKSDSQNSSAKDSIDIFSTWDSWHVIRTTCEYDSRLVVALRLPKMLPEKELQSRWYSEPVQYLTLSPQVFQANKAGHPSLSRNHQEMIDWYMRLKHAPYFLLCDVGPEVKPDPQEGESVDVSSSSDFPSLSEAAAHSAKGENKQSGQNAHSAYLQHLQRQQEPFGYLEQPNLTNFQDWLQSPLQPLSDNLESVTYEVFEGDPVKYHQYEMACVEALREWSEQKKPTSSPNGVVIAVAGSGRGPLVTRALQASKTTGVPVQVYAVEKNPNAYVYLLRQNQKVWDGKVTVVKTDMRAWKGPLLSGSPDDNTAVYGKVDILVSELLGSFGDNELSPECLDGIQHVLAPEHGISIPKTYTAHLSPISTPRLFADISQRLAGGDANAFDTPWVVRLFQLDFVAQRGVPDRPRFQQCWEFAHPLPQVTMDMVEARRSGGVVGGGGGSMAGGVGANDHNSRYCHQTFVCRNRGVIHGLAGYFESVLYAPTTTASSAAGGTSSAEQGTPTPVELSILPEQIDRKSKDMISWFPIFFPLKTPLYFPPDSELEVSMWRQTDDTKVWYEWMVEAYMWVGESQRVKVGGSDMCSSRKVACLM
ncbi:protein arginine N-methyltransferase [Microdochium trichocladiopsis]|uniref:Protein arginine N-methyltransferase n=1 Tax=Microdochium trichocladiopsis TaxID=1682393 RepID=A0A9P8YIK1_9PEZI|nr:protein arginine N-methyltransferase [Microdochium trichocladiopsis]KAH7040657.1 protein arginine N-methyltransferase [Microdochium trichocladiopsis]